MANLRVFLSSERPGVFNYCSNCLLPPKESSGLCTGCFNLFYCDERCQKRAWPIHRLYCTRNTIFPTPGLAWTWLYHNLDDIVSFSLNLYGVNEMMKTMDRVAFLHLLQDRAKATYPAFTLVMVQAPPMAPAFAKVAIDPGSVCQVDSNKVGAVVPSEAWFPASGGKVLFVIGLKMFSYDQRSAPLTDFIPIHIPSANIFNRLPVLDPISHVNKWFERMAGERAQHSKKRTWL